MIAVLTYDNPHKKTYDLLLHLVARGHKDILVLATPWEEKKSFKPLYPHRPQSSLPVHPREICENIGYRYEVVPAEALPAKILAEDPEMVLIAGAGILPEDLLNTKRFINSHPAYLPNVRGLDALKWAIYEGEPIGVTVHIATPEADAGPFLSREEVPLYYWDTFHSLAYRQYDLEIRRLVDAIDLIREGVVPQPIDVTGIPVHRRMPHTFETRLMERFAERVRRAPIEPPST